MSESKFETVSSLVDNYQAQDDSVLQDVLKDNDMADTWQRYHLIGDAIRDELPNELDFDLTDAIANAIAEEPTVLAPIAKPTIKEKIKAKVVQFSKPFGQVAIAASAAGMMVIGVQQNVASNDTQTPYQVADTGRAVGGIAEPVSLNFQQNARVSQEPTMAEQHRKFHALLQDHKQQLKISALATSEVTETPIQEAEKSAK
ncbi:sigma-E factor negative regulatory protein [Thalassotalea marina]|uniref:Anti-sigma-E factor RseA n=1 Tax=Thalassotalea marina TaxID=1673741 RepID=A0A919BDI7_9GAMM|nr:RseA family anti-sigma factor [Thalassotalea marina]GHF84497.1 anti-sigma-E factor RseA [Thalassotalea marina]